MIVSASRRTDVPRFFMDWFVNRLEAGYVLVRNPVRRDLVSRVPLDADSVDCIAFWTKDPRPLLALRSRLERAVPCPYFVQFTLNAYGADVEAGLPRKARLVEVFQELAHVLGPERVVWRYSPILLGGSYDVEHHLRYFETFARTLEGSTRRCRLSFLDVYRKIAPRMEALGLSGVPDAEKRALAQRLAEIAAGFGIEVGGCGDPALDEAGLAGEGCIDAAHVEQVAGVVAARGRGSRRQGACRCAPSVDVGSYDTCANGCVYCEPRRERRRALAAFAVRPRSPDALRRGAPGGHGGGALPASSAKGGGKAVLEGRLSRRSRTHDTRRASAMRPISASPCVRGRRRGILLSTTSVRRKEQP